MSGKAEVIANNRRSCFDKLSTNSLDFQQETAVIFARRGLNPVCNVYRDFKVI
jgi:hypothetical protein